MEKTIAELYKPTFEGMQKGFKKKVHLTLYKGPEQKRCIPYDVILAVAKARFKEVEPGVFKNTKGFVFEVVKTGYATRCRTTFKDGSVLVDLPVTSDFGVYQSFNMSNNFVDIDADITCHTASIGAPDVWFI